MTATPLHRRIVTMMREYMAMATFTGASDFVSWLQNQGFEPDSDLKNEIGVKTQTFTITSTGQVGDASVRITAVISYKSGNEGTVLYWRVD